MMVLGKTIKNFIRRNWRFTMSLSISILNIMPLSYTGLHTAHGETPWPVSFTDQAEIKQLLLLFL
jgi:hypothetical protein